LKVGRAVLAFWLLTLAYVGLLFWLDRGKGLLSGFDRLYLIFPTLMLFAFASLGARYARWYWLLARTGAEVRPMRGFIAYLSGFAFTATPGKVGELLRIRYFQPMGVPPERVVAAFVFERVFDLLVVLCLAGIAAASFGVFPVAAGFVALVLSAVFLLAKYPDRVLHFAHYLERRHLRRLARLAEVFAHGFSNTRIWLTPLDVLVSAAAGFIAWGLTAYAFVLLLDQLALSVPALLAFSLYPVAMLAGAASMLPGGIGSTEAVLIALLAGLGVSLANATLAAVGIRLATLWFATLLGLLSMLALEFVAMPGASTKASPRQFVEHRKSR
jgi:uncharacterized protein (TIRG00374 family)